MSTGQLEIREQPRLPVSRQVEICADGIQHRLFRSLTTLVVVVLAVAFLMNVLSESVVVRACKEGINRRLEPIQEVTRLLSLTGLRGGEVTAERLRARVAQAQPGSPTAALAAGWTRMDADQFSEFRRQCVEATRAARWLSGLKLAHRRLLFGDARTGDDLARLADPNEWAAFSQRLRLVPDVRPPRTLAGVVRDYPALKARLESAAAAFAESSEALGELRSGALRAWFARAAEDPAQDAALADFLAAHRLELSDLQRRELAREAKLLEEVELLRQAVTASDLRRAYLEQYKDQLSFDMAVERLAAGGSEGRWIAQQAAPAVKAAGLDADGLGDLARRVRDVRAAEALKTRLDAEYGEEEGIGTNVFWLVVVSMIVCAVGIANAMLVSVLERFREIATMKCLGAMDGLIATLFLLEAAFLGLVGGVIGVVLGAAIGLGRMFVSFGSWVGEFFPLQGLLVMAAVSIVTGLVLTTLASIYPAFRAAKMLPMEAMRVE